MAVKASNTITLMRVDDGTGYTVLLSNEAHSFEGGTSAALAGSTATNVIAYKNTSQIPVTVSNIGGTAVSGNPTGIATGVTGLTASVTGNGTTSCKITFQATTSLTAMSGSVSITIAVDGRSFTKNFSFSITLKGPAGRTYFIESSSNVLKRSADNSISPNFVEFKAYYRDGNSATRYAYSGRFIIEETTDGNTWKTIYTSAANENSVKHYLYSMLADATGAAVASANGDTIGIPRDVVAVRCKLYAAGGTTNLMDMQSVAVVVDVDALTHEEIFDLLTNNGEVKGIYKEGNQLYISFTYAKGGSLDLGGANNQKGAIRLFDNNNIQIGSWNNGGLTTNDNSGKYKTKLENGRLYLFSDNTKTVAIYGDTGTFGGLFSLYRNGSPYIDFQPYTANIGSSFLEVEGTALFSKDVQIEGDLIVKTKGYKSKIINTKNYGTRALYCYEMPSPMFGDIGTGMTDEHGECCISIGDIFSETILSEIEYQVFLQKEADGDLWVEKKSPQYFLVKGTSGLKFAWEIKAKQHGCSTEYLEEIFELSNNSVSNDTDYETEYIAEINKLLAEVEEIMYEAT